ncbi:TolC family protein [Sphingobacterium sp. BIGb0165]|uniref:TolC family protein n=1 Tax=Sphingobacterium sp. BIGb0165 TaxID=2940615 RepID=UPI0021689CA4|nr:TolC family protein [Sphingobacterium sp. BIGb0165]MCS4226107.1 outer membrane protein [Sphingobacterium sp. BIGb0165]
MKRFYYSAVIFTGFFLGTNNLIQAQQVVGVAEAIRMTLERNVQIKQAELSKDLAAQDLFQAKSNLYPSLSASVSQQLNNGLFVDRTTNQLVKGNQWSYNMSPGIGSSVNIFKGFQQVNQIKANKMQLEASATQVDKIKNDLVLNVLVTYLEAITNYEMYTASGDQLKLSQQQFQLDSIQFAVGNKTIADIAKSKNQVASDELNRINLKNSYELSMLTLKQLMEMAPQTEISLVRPSVDHLLLDADPKNPVDVFQRALNNQPDIKKALIDKDVAAKQIEIAKGGYLPSLNLDVNYGSNYSWGGRDPVTLQKIGVFEQFKLYKSFGTGMTLSVPIFSNNQNKVNVAKAKIGLKQAEAAEQLAKNNLNKAVNQAVLDVSAAKQRFTSATTAFESAETAYKATKERYDIGMANSLELFTAQTERNKAEFDLIQAKYNVIFKSKIIDYYLGNPIQFDNN